MIEYRNTLIVIARKLGLSFLVVSCVGCSSIHIESAGESSPNTGTSDDSAVQASQMQSNWLSYFRSLPQERKGHAMRRMVDSASASFLEYGLDLANEWNGIQGDQERTIGGVEFQRIMQLSEQQKNPFIRAYLDMAHEAASAILADSKTSSEVSRLIPEYIGQMEKLSKEPFLPTGTLNEYRISLEEMHKTAADLSYRLETELGADQ